MKTPEEVAHDVINGWVEGHDTLWWRSRASTLAVKYLDLAAGKAEAPEKADYKSLDGLIAAARKITEKVAMDVSAAYEEMDGLRRPMSSPMGRLMHETNSNLGTMMTLFALIENLAPVAGKAVQGKPE